MDSVDENTSFSVNPVDHAAVYPVGAVPPLNNACIEPSLAPGQEGGVLIKTTFIGKGSMIKKLLKTNQLSLTTNTTEV